jgi:uncharacterized repeat protein (TIGR03837 family)
MGSGKLWDVFCRVIDNYGDIGVCWRLATGLVARGQRVRLWVDDTSALQWMAPEGAPGVELRAWTQELGIGSFAMGDVAIEAFGCDINAEFLTAFAQHAAASGQDGLWLNLEYLSAEAYVERCHGLPSPKQVGPGAGLQKYFFYPGFAEATGGLLREPDLTAQQADFEREAWLSSQAIEFRGEQLVCLFCYEPPALDQLLNQLAGSPRATRLLVTAGRATAAVKSSIERKNDTEPTWNMGESLLFSYLPALAQPDFDRLLWSCDLNFVRGEDSLVRALWADKPFVWQPYPQTDNAQQGKLEAFLNLLEAPSSLRTFHATWNGFSQAALPAIALSEWQQAVSQTRARQLLQDDLVTRIIQFGQKNR